MIRPIDVALNATGLTQNDGSFIASLTTTTRAVVFKDQLLLFNNAQVALNKQPSAIYYFVGETAKVNPGWRMVGDGAENHGSDLIPGGKCVGGSQSEKSGRPNQVLDKRPDLLIGSKTVPLAKQTDGTAGRVAKPRP